MLVVQPSHALLADLNANNVINIVSFSLTLCLVGFIVLVEASAAVRQDVALL